MLLCIPASGRGVVSRNKTTATAFSRFRGGRLNPAERDCRLPGLSAGLAAMVAVIANRFVRDLLYLMRLRGYIHPKEFEVVRDRKFQGIFITC
jgi:hypothetical protein